MSASERERTSAELIEEALPPKTHPLYQLWKDYKTNVEERGQPIIEVVERYTNINGKKVLDMGCGTGVLSIAFARAGADVVGIDSNKYTQNHLKIAKVRAEEEQVNSEIICGDGERIPFRDKVFDIIICNDVIEHVPNPQKFAKEISRILKGEGGVLYLTAPNKLSLSGILHDPHYGYFGVILLPRTIGKFYVTKIRGREKMYTVYRIPTYRYLARIFKNVNIALDYINKEECDKNVCDKLYHPMNIKNKKMRAMCILLQKLGLTKIIIPFLLPLHRSYFIFIGIKINARGEK